ncbi:MAG: hypothetical protein J6A75_03980 [Lachnospiraceae bacterium]|nr:hypothetical protein [Lachnospiraceae bacterium]
MKPIRTLTIEFIMEHLCTSTKNKINGRCVIRGYSCFINISLNAVEIVSCSKPSNTQKVTMERILLRFMEMPAKHALTATPKIRMITEKINL